MLLLLLLLVVLVLQVVVVVLVLVVLVVVVLLLLLCCRTESVQKVTVTTIKTVKDGLMMSQKDEYSPSLRAASEIRGGFLFGNGKWSWAGPGLGLEDFTETTSSPVWFKGCGSGVSPTSLDTKESGPDEELRGFSGLDLRCRQRCSCQGS